MNLEINELISLKNFGGGEFGSMKNSAFREICLSNLRQRISKVNTKISA